VEFIPGMPGWCYICKSMNMTHYVNRLKGKNHVILSKDEKKELKTFNILP
jgi:hypothetical protein